MRRAGHRLIVTADDFGLAPAVNEAVEIAHRDGILSAASLMVGAPAAADAVARARRLPHLRVGLHLVLVDGAPVLPRERIPDLVGADGMLRRNMVGFSFALAARPALQIQIAAEVEAQFEAFRATGLALDHVNAHRHFHLHPIVARIVLAVGRRYGLRGLRVPYEPAALLHRVGATGRTGVVERMMALRLRRTARAAGLVTADAVLGLRWSGAMTTDRIMALLESGPAGVVEIYTHPATTDVFDGAAAGYQYADELAALCDPACRAILRGDPSPGGYADVDAPVARCSAPFACARPT